MITEADLEFDTNDDREMIDEDGDPVYCESEFCEAPAMHRVAISEETAHDATRDYCAGCYEIYTIGVQHGRFHEAARYGAKPGRKSAQDPPGNDPVP